MAGLYSYDSIEFNSLSTPHIEYLLTDENGVISFPHAKFSEYGPSDYFLIAYNCNGEQIK